MLWTFYLLSERLADICPFSNSFHPLKTDERGEIFSSVVSQSMALELCVSARDIDRSQTRSRSPQRRTTSDSRSDPEIIT